MNKRTSTTLLNIITFIAVSMLLVGLYGVRHSPAEHVERYRLVSSDGVASPSKEATSKSLGVCGASPCVALTFDDGPGQYTEQLLEILKQYETKATFFVVGEQVTRNPGLARKIVRAGHQIGNHTWNHPDLSQMAPYAIKRELDDTSAAIKQATGVIPTIMRPPYGALSPTASREIGNAGMSSILWDVDTRDWADRNSTIVCNRAVANTQPGSIILMHDIHKTSVDAVPCIVNQLSKSGYKFVTVEELLGKTTPGVSYFSGS